MGGCDDRLACVAPDVERLRPIVHDDDTDGCVDRNRPRPNDLNARGYASSRHLIAARASGGSNLLYLLICLHQRLYGLR
jgi:hypothetical protein